jgi:hypothetical protein
MTATALRASILPERRCVRFDGGRPADVGGDRIDLGRTRPHLLAGANVTSKRCPRCCPLGVQLPSSRFPRNRARPDGLGSFCLECKRAVDRKYWQRNAERLAPIRSGQKRARRNDVRSRVLDYLLEHPCVDCGERDPVVLDFDHVRAGKAANVSALVADGYDWDVITAEVAKCVVRCANCHRRREARKRGYFRTTSGSLSQATGLDPGGQLSPGRS